mgnify:CR=1 FL=1
MTAPRASVQVVGAQVIAQVSLVAVLPFLTRTYSTTDIGYFQLAMAVAMTAQPLATLRSEFAVPSLVTDSAVRRLVRTGLLVLSIVVLVGCCLSALLARSHAGPAQVALMAALMLAGLGWTAIDNAVLIRSGDTGRLAVAQPPRRSYCSRCPTDHGFRWRRGGVPGGVGPRGAGRGDRGHPAIAPRARHEA